MSNPDGSGCIVHSLAVMHRVRNCALIGKHLAELESPYGRSKKHFQNGGELTLIHPGNMVLVQHYHQIQLLPHPVSIVFHYLVQGSPKLLHPVPVKNFCLGGRMVPFDYSLSSVLFTAVDKRAPAGSWTLLASNPNFSGLDDKLAQRYHPMMNPKGRPVRTRRGFVDSYAEMA